ncbi:MAG: hypothetical protein ABIH76_06365 [Candidatus Bathyarchaeota archaeon]
MCEEYVLQMGVGCGTMKAGRKVILESCENQKVEPYVCRKCGETFLCNEHCMKPGMETNACRNTGNLPQGPCCAKPPTSCQTCWEGMPYYEAWLQGRYKEYMRNHR